MLKTENADNTNIAAVFRVLKKRVSFCTHFRLDKVEVLK